MPRSSMMGMRGRIREGTGGWVGVCGKWSRFGGLLEGALRVLGLCSNGRYNGHQGRQWEALVCI